MKRYSALLAAILALPLAVVLSVSSAQAAGDATAGKAVYAKKCQGCHGLKGEKAKFGAITFNAVNSKEVQGRSDADLKKQSVSGVTGKMMKTNGVSDADLDNVVAYMRTLK
ncbi:MAG: c-type cytochrome [Candidatus Acidiferrales bacterium]